MARVVFTPNLQHIVPCPPCEAAGTTVREVLDAAFEGEPRLRGYLLDDQGRLRKHVTVFLDGRPIEDRVGLGDAVGADSELFVMQALSGGAANVDRAGGKGEGGEA